MEAIVSPVCTQKSFVKRALGCRLLWKLKKDSTKPHKSSIHPRYYNNACFGNHLYFLLPAGHKCISDSETHVNQESPSRESDLCYGKRKSNRKSPFSRKKLRAAMCTPLRERILFSTLVTAIKSGKCRTVYVGKTTDKSQIVLRKDAAHNFLSTTPTRDSRAYLNHYWFTFSLEQSVIIQESNVRP
jgi:hypothetical protein